MAVFSTSLQENCADYEKRKDLLLLFVSHSSIQHYSLWEFKCLAFLSHKVWKDVLVHCFRERNAVCKW